MLEVRTRLLWAVGLAVQLVSSMCLTLGLGSAMVVCAQGVPPTGWSPPINLSNTPAQSEAAAIVADPTGMVHVFWAENLDEPTNYSNAIFYTRWNGHAWSRPHDIMISPEGKGSAAGSPSAVVSSDGRINLAWAGGWGGTVYFSSARADEAISAQAWRRPLPASKVGDMAGEPRLALEDNGRLHLLYAVAQGVEQGLYHTSSDDGGQRWSTPSRIPGSRLASNRILLDPRLAVSPDGALHVAWAWANWPESMPPQGVSYSRSGDGGETWSKPLAVASGPYRYPEVAAVGAREVHLVWCGTEPDRHKFHQWSQDGGQTWSRPTQVLEIGGLQGYGGMAIDGGGRPHLALIGGHPEFGDVVYHLAWNGQSWGSPEVVLRIMEPVGQNPRDAAIAIANGNEAHIVAEIPVSDAGPLEWQMDILHASAQLGAPRVEPVPLPTLTPTPAPTELPTAEPTGGPAVAAASATPVGPARFHAARASDPAGAGAAPLTLGVVACLALGAAVAIHAGRRRREDGGG